MTKFQEGQTVWVKADFAGYAGANQAWVLIQGEAELAQLEDIREKVD
ncbi:hypothetical protein [Streptococcus minor]|nr:hypothetical protein [Streptococcus minor]